MTRELFVSATPHETKVGLVEDDQLAEIYLELENEYTLAGSIYKGRVTRVLPGMQSAFVDIGLERDAFLYVSDFMEVEEGDEIEEIPTNRGVSPENTRQQSQPRTEPQPRNDFQPAARNDAQPFVIESPDFEGEAEPSFNTAEPVQTTSSDTRESSNGGETGGEDRGGFRGRRRRRGRRGERMPESKYARPAESQREQSREASVRTEPRSERPARSERSEYGPPPGYQPILLPGESISKYQRLSQNQNAAPRSFSSGQEKADPSPVLSKSYPEDEPLFAKADAVAAPPKEEQQASVAVSETASERERDHEDERLDVAELPEPAAEAHKDDDETGEVELRIVEEVQQPAPQAYAQASAGTMEEEEIEEEEADLSSYVEELEEDATFEELEEETHAAEEFHQHETGEIAASGDAGTEVAEDRDPVVLDVEDQDDIEEIVDEPAAEGEEDGDDDSEIEEAQAEAEAALDAEARGNGTVDAQAEVRAPNRNAAYTQRAQRPGFDRRGNRGRRGGGKRFPRRQEQQQLPQITDLLKEGQEILVQIAKEPIGKKGARITSHIALPGRFLVYMPTVNHTGVSRKIASEEERQRLKRIIISERENGHGGFIVRTAAQGANEEELRADIRFLKGLWNEIKTRAENGKAPALIYHDLNVVERVLRDQVTSDFSAIWVDNEQEYERILRFANRFQPALVRRVKLYTKETPLYEQFGLKEEIDKALKSKVWLKSGGYIVINQTEALVAIDVNTGKYVGKTARLEDTIVKTNVDAIKEIVRQIRLRDLGGIIVIDFIDMDERRNRQKVMQALEEALRSDRAPSKVLQFNDFGLVAITRKRVKQSLERTIGSPCPYCQSTGFVKSVNTICNEIYVELRKVVKHIDSADVMLRVNPEVAKALKANSGKALIEMEELTKKTVIVKSDPALHQEQFDVN
jgi:Rne/Rng family ribonuclease